MTKPTSPLLDVIEKLIEPDERVYAVVDAARAPTLAIPDDFLIPRYSLLVGQLAPLLDHVAPHLIPVELDSPYIDLWEQRLGTSAGILLFSKLDPEDLRLHLRGDYVVEDENGNEFFFRFFDPRVIRGFLRSSTVEELFEFFGPIRLILVESETMGMLYACQPSPERLKMDIVKLNAATRPQPQTLDKTQQLDPAQFRQYKEDSTDVVDLPPLPSLNKKGNQS